MQIISILSIVSAIYLTLMNYHNTVSVNLLSEKFSQLLNIQSYGVSFDIAIYTIIIFGLGVVSISCFILPLYNSLKDKYNAYKRELEKGSITNTSSEAKIKVLENKINVLEKALEDALKKRS